MVTRVTNNPTTPARTHGMPSAQELQKIYGGVAHRAEQHHTLKKLTNPPAGWERAPSFNVAEGAMGVGKEVFVLKGHVYLRTQVMAHNAKPSWFDAGPAPLF
jgi:hypothetical protein